MFFLLAKTSAQPSWVQQQLLLARFKGLGLELG
jgi:hypothetical protein